MTWKLRACCPHVHTMAMLAHHHNNIFWDLHTSVVLLFTTYPSLIMTLHHHLWRPMQCLLTTKDPIYMRMFQIRVNLIKLQCQSYTIHCNFNKLTINTNDSFVILPFLYFNCYCKCSLFILFCNLVSCPYTSLLGCTLMNFC